MQQKATYSIYTRYKNSIRRCRERYKVTGMQLATSSFLCKVTFIRVTRKLFFNEKDEERGRKRKKGRE